MMFYGFQIEIQALITFDATGTYQTGYQRVYYVRNNIVNHDQARTSSQNIYNPCDSNPCRNNGTCLIGFNNSISCFCPENYNGGLLSLKNYHENSNFKYYTGTFCDTIYVPIVSSSHTCINCNIQETESF
jgi:hypothetical protein